MGAEEFLHDNTISYLLFQRQKPIAVTRDYQAQNMKDEDEKTQQTLCSNQKQSKRSSQKIFGRTGLQLRGGIKACRPGFCSSREEELITDWEGREKETSSAR